MTAGQRQNLLKQCRGIRVTDWHDALDTLGRFDRGLMEPRIRPLWRDADGLTHRIVGFAFTLRYVPSGRTIVAGDAEEFARQEREWYGEEPKWGKELAPGDVVVIDGSGTRDTGYVGSMNSLCWMAAGAVGIVTNSGVRDTDELIKQRVPVYCDGLARGIIPGRVELESYRRPVECGGVLVRPGDLIVADGDGVIVIPAQLVPEALPLARRIQQSDQRNRARLYKKLGIEPDFTLGEAAEQP